MPFCFFFSSRRRHTRYIGDWSSDVCSSDLGTPFGDPQASRVEKLEVLPREILMHKPGLAQQMLVIAHYGDGASRDVTRSEERRVGKGYRERERTVGRYGTCARALDGRTKIE